MRILKLTTLSFLLMAGSASAADPQVFTAADPQVFAAADSNFEQRWSWTGFSAGLEAGYSWSNDEIVTGAPAACVFGPDCTAEGNGGIYGGFVGYTHQFGSIVGGVEAGYTKIGTDFDDASGVSIADAWTIKGRVGYAMDRFQLYGLLGASRVTTESPIAILADSDWGIVYGAGLDVGITENIFAGIQYTRHQFTDFAGLGIDAGMDNVMVRIGYIF